MSSPKSPNEARYHGLSIMSNIIDGRHGDVRKDPIISILAHRHRGIFRASTHTLTYDPIFMSRDMQLENMTQIETRCYMLHCPTTNKRVLI